MLGLINKHSCKIRSSSDVKALTHDIISKLVLSDVIKQGGKHWQQGNGCVVNVLGHTFNLL